MRLIPSRLASIAVSAALALLPSYGNTELSVLAILTDMNPSYGEWMVGPLDRAPRVGWRAVNSGYVVFDPDLERTPLRDDAYYLLIETTPGRIQNIYPLEGNRVRKEFDIGKVAKKDGLYIYEVKKCDDFGCNFVGQPLLVLHYILHIDNVR